MLDYDSQPLGHTLSATCNPSRAERAVGWVSLIISIIAACQVIGYLWSIVHIDPLFAIPLVLIGGITGLLGQAVTERKSRPAIAGLTISLAMGALTFYIESLNHH